MKLLKRKEDKKTEQEKVEERREEVLSKGRKFKYPLQWTRHRIVVNTVLIAFVAISLLMVGGWLALYRLNMTDELLFRITEALPISVAKVDDENVRFSDYLMFYRSSIISIERQSSASDTEGSFDALRAEYKIAALEKAEKYAFALKLAGELGIEVSDSEIDAEYERHRKVGGTDRSEEGFLKILSDNFGLSKSEYRRMLYLSLIKSKVETEIDEAANEISRKIEKMLAENNGDYQAVAEALGDAVIYEETGGLVDSKNIDGGRASEALKLEPGTETGRFISMNGDGYYFVKLLEKTEAEVNFVSLRVPFSEFETRFTTLREANKIQEYTKIIKPAI